MPISLEQARVGADFDIATIEDPTIAPMALRLGIQAGQRVTLSSRLPGGPSVLRRGGQEIALGRDICKGIQVSDPCPALAV